MSRYAWFDNIDWEIADSMEELVSGADVVVSCITDAEDCSLRIQTCSSQESSSFRSILVAFKTATQFSTRSLPMTVLMSRASNTSISSATSLKSEMY